MSTEQRKRHQRRKRHSHRKIRVVALILAGLSFVMGAVMWLWALSERSETHRLFGTGYLAAGCLALITYAVVARFNPLTWLRAQAERANEGRRESRSGLALLTVLLLMALLSGTLLHAMVQTRQALREAEWRRAGVLLRAAALDGALSVLRAAALGRPLPLSAPAESLLPSGIAVRTRVLPLASGAIPALLRRAEAPVFGDCYELAVEATQEGRSRRARGLICQMPTGDLRVLAWTETL